MTGLVRAVIAMGLCTALGAYLSLRQRARLIALGGWLDALDHIKALLVQERLPMDELIRAAAVSLPKDSAVSKRLFKIARGLSDSPSLTLERAYAIAQACHPIEGEQPEEKEALSACFARLGQGTALTREQAAEHCLRRLRRLEQEQARKGREAAVLYVKLGALCGIALAIILI